LLCDYDDDNDDVDEDDDRDVISATVRTTKIAATITMFDVENS